jgi:group I intron endonuclease
MYLALIILPLLGSIASGLFGKKIGVTGSQLITTSLVIITTFLAIIAYLEVGLNSIPVSIHLFRWIDSESLIVYWGFHFDSLTTSMLLPVLIVSSLVHVYSIGYMSHDPRAPFNLFFKSGEKDPRSCSVGFLNQLTYRLTKEGRECSMSINRNLWLVIQLIEISRGICHIRFYSLNLRGYMISAVDRITWTLLRLLVLMCGSRTRPNQFNLALDKGDRFSETKYERRLGIENSGLPKGRNPHGNGSAILGKRVRKISSSYHRPNSMLSPSFYHCQQTRVLYNSFASPKRWYSTKKPLTAIKVYTNVYTQKAKILAENRGKSGVYRFTNLTNNKTYVGCAVNLKARIYKYFRLKDLLRAKCMPICYAILKYKLNNFKLEILEYCNKEDCLRKEKDYIDSLKPEYNILREGFSRLGTKHTVEAKAKIGAARLGKILSEVTKARLSKALKDRTILRETKEKMSSAKGGSGIDVINSVTRKTVTYISGREAAAALGCDEKTIRNYIKSGKLFRNVYIKKGGASR